MDPQCRLYFTLRRATFVVDIVEHLVGEKINFGGIAIVGEPRVPQLDRQHAGLEARHEHVPEMFKGCLHVRFQNAAADFVKETSCRIKQDCFL